jgi:hypothetical protein
VVAVFVGDFDGEKAGLLGVLGVGPVRRVGGLLDEEDEGGERFFMRAEFAKE